MPSRWLAIASVAIATCGCALDNSSRWDTSGPRPNIVLIVADDLGWADVGYHEDRMRTPHIDSIARAGVEIDRFYVSPTCTQTRAGLMTGRYPLRFGLARNQIAPWIRFGLDTSETTIADALDRAGYRHRAVFGKWHLGHLDSRWHPLNRGFTQFRGHYNGGVDYFTHVRHGERDWHVDFEPSDEPGYTTDLVADAASRFIIERAGDSPFFCYVAFNAPHVPHQAPDEYIRTYDRLDGKSRVVAAMISSLDDGIGRVLESIDDAGVAENTLVWFLSDNGGIREIRGNNQPLRGNKPDVFDGNVRVPSCVRWPAGLPRASVLETPVAYIDLLPTILEIAGLHGHEGKPLDGVSMLDVLRGEAEAQDRDLYFFNGQFGADAEKIAILTSQWKLVVIGPDLRNGVSDRHRRMLFDITRDPSESRDLSARNSRVVEELTGRLVEFRALQPANSIPPYDSGRADFVPPEEWRIPSDGQNAG